MSRIAIECNICCIERKTFIKCLLCEESVCLDCQERYILEQSTPNCMMCKKEWTYHFLRENFPKTFMDKTYKQVKEKQIFELEKTFFPTLQRELQEEEKKDNEKEEQKFKDKVYSNCFSRISYDNEDMCGFLVYKDENYAKLSFLDTYDNWCLEEDDNKKNYINRAYKLSTFGFSNHFSTNFNKLFDIVHSVKREQIIQPIVFTKGCPKNECKGFYSSDYKCSMCEASICKDCQCVIDVKELETNTHKCDPNILASVSLIKSDTKDCPSCHTSIHRIHGCNTMWCVNCKTGFDYVTGKSLGTRVHNPHYFAYMNSLKKEKKENKEDIISSSEDKSSSIVKETKESLEDILTKKKYTYKDIREIFSKTNYDVFFKEMEKLEDTNKTKFPPYDPINENVDLRKDYLRDKIDEKKYKTVLSQRFKKGHFNTEVNQLLSMFINLSKEKVVEFFNDRVKEINFKRVDKYLNLDTKVLYNELKDIHKYLVEHIEKVSKVYGYSIPKVGCFSSSDYYWYFN